MRLLVLGANGLLGSNVVTAASAQEHDVVGTYHSTEPDFDVPLEQLDITSSDDVRGLIDVVGPDAVVNCAAMTDVDGCESSPDQAFAVNATAPTLLADECHRREIQFTHVSTDYVFDGRGGAPYDDTARPNPIQTYGRSKLLGERAVRGSASRCLIPRLSFVWGVHAGSDEVSGFPRWVRDSLQSDDSVPLFTDQHVTPTRAGQAATVILDLIQSGTTGTFNVACRSCISPFEFGKAIERHIDDSSGEIRESSMENGERPAPRPIETCLGVDRVEAIRGEPQPTFEEDVTAISDYL